MYSGAAAKGINPARPSDNAGAGDLFSCPKSSQMANALVGVPGDVWKEAFEDGLELKIRDDDEEARVWRAALVPSEKRSRLLLNII